MKKNREQGMTAGQAKMLELSIIGLCVFALILVFQPFSLKAYSVGAVLVIVGGLAFNLVPFCRKGVPFDHVVRAVTIVVVTLLVVTALAILSAWLYGQFFVGQP